MPGSHAPPRRTIVAVKPVPDGFHTVTPYLVVKDVAGLCEFLAAGFAAEEIERTQNGSGRIMHAEVRIGDSVVMLGEAMDGFPPQPSTLYLYVPDCDATYQQAIRAGGMSVMEPANQFYGDRKGAIRDPAGNAWWIATHVEDVPLPELARRARERK
jgi:PhnB protein